MKLENFEKEYTLSIQYRSVGNNVYIVKDKINIVVKTADSLAELNAWIAEQEEPKRTVSVTLTSKVFIDVPVDMTLEEVENTLYDNLGGNGAFGLESYVDIYYNSETDTMEANEI
jgi:hypothetical protein